MKYCISKILILSVVICRIVFVLVLVQLSTVNWCNGQLIRSAVPKFESMGNATVALSDAWSILANPAGMGEEQHISVMASYNQLYSVRELNAMMFGVVIPNRHFNIGISAEQFGTSFFSIQNIALSMADKIGITQIGLRMAYQVIQQEGYPSSGYFQIDGGVITALSDDLALGVSLLSVNQPRLGKVEEEQVPLTLRMGLWYEVSDKVELGTAIEKPLLHDLRLNIGLLYVPVSRIAIRMGARTAPSVLTGGLGLNLTWLTVDYAIQQQYRLGLSHQVGFTYSFNKN